MKYNYYELLQIGYTASNKEIIKAYKKMLFLHHPDTNNGKKGAILSHIMEAYKILMNSQTRFEYNHQLIKLYQKNKNNSLKKFFQKFIKKQKLLY